MQRGEIWTLRDDGYASKARPVIIVQGDLGDVFDSVVLCLFTTFVSDTISTRVKIEPSPENSLKQISYVMTDKILTVARSELGVKVGSLNQRQMHEINKQIARLLVITKEDID
jgi:mRNA interferase MazF